LVAVVAAVLCAFVAAQASSGSQVPARDAPTPRPGTASISGRVTDRETGQPLADVTVSVERRGPGRASDERHITRSDRQGRFELTDLPAGEYYLAARPSNYRMTHLLQYFGDSLPSTLSRPRPREPLVLRDGEVRENADIALWRSLAINGHIIDEMGEPLTNVPVIVEDWRSSSQMATFIQRHSDDRGIFRVFGLPPGQYRVCADVRVFDGVGDFERTRPVRTCYPSATSDAEAQPVVLSTTESGDIEIRLQRSRVFSVSGTIISASGLPLDGIHAGIVYAEKNRSMSTNVAVQPGGQFIVRGLIPGDYAIRVDSGAHASTAAPEREVAYVPLRIASSNIEGLVVVTSKTARVRGRVTFEDGAPEALPKSMSVTVVFDLSTSRMILAGSPSADVKDDLTFELTGMFGPHMLTMRGLAPGYVVRAVRYDGRDITYLPTDFKDSSEARPVEIVLSSRGARLTGRVHDDRGNPTREGVVALFPADSARWNQESLNAGQASIKDDGTFRIGPVPPGEYVILAMSPEAVSWLISGSRDAASVIGAIAERGERITLGESEQKAIDLKVDTGR
jgi:hypothetical protein